MKFLYFTDPHLRGTTPANRIDNFPATLEQKLEEISYLAQTHDVTALLCGGDLWDIPLPAIQTAANYIEILQTAGCPIYAIEGNHDLFGQNPETLGRTMLGFMFQTGMINRLVPGEPVFFEGETQNLKTITVQITGQGYHFEIDRRDPKLDYCIKKAKRPLKVNYAIHLVHGMLLDKPIFGDAPTTLVEQIAPYTEADLTLCGHVHMGFPDQVYVDQRTGQERRFINIGGLTRVSNHISEMQRTPQALLIDFSSGQMVLARIPLQCAQPGQKVLDRSKLEAAAAREEKLAAFASVVEEAGEFRGVNLTQVVDEVAALNNLSGEVRTEGLRRIALAEEELAEPGVSGVHGDGEGGERPYIAWVHIVNFQSHLQTHLKFGPGLNVLVGPSDQGKTAVLRALRWLFFNEPKGTEFFRIGATICYVEALLSNGVKIVRSRDKSTNRYTLTLPSAPGQPEPVEQIFEGFGNEIPAEILAAHGVREVRLDLDVEANLSLARQLDGPFLLSLTGASRAKAIGRLSGVHVIDAGTRALTKDTTNLAAEQRKLSGEVKQLNEDLKAYADLPIMKMRVAKIERNIARLEELERRGEQLRGLAERLDENRRKREEVQELLGSLSQLGTAEVWADWLAEKLERGKALGRVSDALRSVQEQEAAVEQTLRLTEKVEASEVVLIGVEVLYERTARLSSLAAAWAAVLANQERVESILQKTEQVELAEKNAIQLENKLTEGKKLTRVAGGLTRVQAGLVEVQRGIDFTQNLGRAEGNLATLEANRSRGVRLVDLAGRRQVVIRALEDLITILMALKQVEQAEEGLERIEWLVERGKQIGMMMVKLDENRRAVDRVDKDITEAGRILETYSVEYGDLLAESGRCPILLQPCAWLVDREKIAELVREMAS
jgi:exonuclease SbcD